MIFYQDYDYKNFIQYPVKNTNTKMYDDNIYTFDIETTSVYEKENDVIIFDDSKSPEIYKDYEKKGYMYIWQFSINNDVVYGRTWEQFKEFLFALTNNIAGIIIVYVHNLAFESQFLLNVIDDFNIFARSSRHTMKAYSEKYKIEFRCSLILTNAALSKVPKMYKLPVNKMSGDLDYNVLRNSQTVLTDKELKYCEYDCLVVYYLIKKLKEQYNHIFNIPMTQTGMLRRVCQQMYSDDNKYHKWLQKQLPKQIDTLVYILKAFAGGYTHANAYYTGDIIHGVHSKDITSSYPTVMIAEKYPVEPFSATIIKNINNLNTDYCYILTLEFYNIYSVKYNNYLSYSKTIECNNVTLDNGRIVKADYIKIIVTDVDYEIIKQCYNFETVKVSGAMESKKGYLDKKFILKILELYNNKTQYKGLDNMSDNYMQAKQYINSMYGMMVTNLIRDEIVFNDGQWNTKILTMSEAQEKLNKINSNKKTFLCQTWGVFVTAYARRNLWSMILKIDKDVIYCDTDSVKYIGNYENIFADYNKSIINKLENTCKEYSIDINLLNPKDSKNVNHPLGVFDTEEDYYSFKTLGAKKYAFQHQKNGKIEITLSGVSKAGASAITNLSDFKKGFTFDYEKSGKKILTYNDDQTETVLTDDQGHTELRTEKYGINLMPTQYTIGISDDYYSYLNTTEHFSKGGF